MAQSSVEWLVEQILKDVNLRLRGFDIDKISKQAKAMHKEEIETAYKSERYPCSDEDAQDYYNQIFNHETE